MSRRFTVRRMAGRLIGGIALAWCVACGDSFGPDSNIIGTWTGSGTSNGNRITLTMTITDRAADGTVTGSGQVSGAIGVPVSIAGTFSGGTLRVNVAAIGFISAVYTGTPDGRNTLNGHLDSSGFSNMPLTLHRQ